VEGIPSNQDGEENQDKFNEWEQKNYDVTIGDLLEKSFPSLFKLITDDNDSTNEFNGLQ